MLKMLLQNNTCSRDSFILLGSAIRQTFLETDFQSPERVWTKRAQLISENYNNSHNRVKITLQGGVTIFGVNITPKRSYFFP